MASVHSLHLIRAAASLCLFSSCFLAKSVATRRARPHGPAQSNELDCAAARHTSAAQVAATSSAGFVATAASAAVDAIASAFAKGDIHGMSQGGRGGGVSGTDRPCSPGARAFGVSTAGPGSSPHAVALASGGSTVAASAVASSVSAIASDGSTASGGGFAVAGSA